MKLSFSMICRTRRLRRAESGYTLVEALVAASLFGLMVSAIIVCHFVGLQMNQYVLPKVQIAQCSRQALSRMIEEIRAANGLQVGTGTVTTFTPAGTTNYQMGNAVRIYPTTNTSQFVYYFHDASSRTLQKIQLMSTNTVVIEGSVTNDTVFSMEDYAGNVLTNVQNNAVLGVLLQVRTPPGWRGMCEAYQVRTKVTPRKIL